MTTVIATTNFDWAKIEHYCATLKSEVSGERFGCDGFWVSLPAQVPMRRRTSSRASRILWWLALDQMAWAGLSCVCWLRCAKLW